jgi:3-hydroxy-9,10-secoandrosta-1,3,5(10)-triene-9,17-dione monooxygenase reductase component
MSDPRTLRHALGRFATGVAVMTTLDAAGRPVGLTANSFSAVSLDPPIVAWSLRAEARLLPVFHAAPAFAVNVLAAAQEHLSNRFASPAEDRFAGVDWEAGAGGVPLLPGCLARFVCHTRERIPAGDHVLFLGTVAQFDHADGAPLVFFASRYGLPPAELARAA